MPLSYNLFDFFSIFLMVNLVTKAFDKHEKSFFFYKSIIVAVRSENMILENHT